MNSSINYSKNGNLRKLKILIILTLLILPAMACGAGNPNEMNNGNIIVSSGGDVVEQNETLEEFSIILGFRFGLVDKEGDTLFNLMTGYDMQPEFIRVWGTYSQSNGEGAPGSADVTFSIENGDLVTKIIGLDMEGIDADDPRVLQFNQDISDSFKERLMESEIVEFTNIELVNNSIEITYLAEVD